MTIVDFMCLCGISIAFFSVVGAIAAALSDRGGPKYG